MATILQNFDIRNKKDSDGHEIPIPVGHTDGFIMCVYPPHIIDTNRMLMHKLSHPVLFECSITPRSTEARNIIMKTVGEACA